MSEEKEKKEIEQEKEAPKEKKKASKSKKQITKSILIALNVIGFFLLSYQGYSLFDKYSTNAKNYINLGKEIIVDAKTSEIQISDFNIEEFFGKKLEEEKSEEEQEIVTEETTEEEQLAEDYEEGEIATVEPPKALDYSTANLSIIITDLGMKQKALALSSTLPKEVSFAFSPYSDQLQEKIDSAKEEGREVLLNVLLEPSDYPLQDEGPLTIQRHFEETENITRLQETSNKAEGYTGYLTNTTEIVTHNLENIAPIMNNIKDRGKFFGFFRQPVNSYLEKEAKPMALDIMTVDFLIDQDPQPEKILNALNNVKQELLESKRKVVISLRPYPNSIKALQGWMDNNIGSKIQIAPISYFITDN